MQLSNVSASQVDSFVRCQRYWYNKSVLKIPTPTTPQQQRGKDIHSAIENYLRHGTIEPAWSQHVQVAIPHLPKPKDEDVLIEHKIELNTFPGGPIWIGYADLIIFKKLPVKISDHKSTGNFKYIKTPDELADNIQMNSYGKWVVDNVDYSNEVEYEHIYIGTRDIKSKPVSRIVTRDHINKIWSRDLDRVREMAEVAKLEPVTAEVLPPTYDSCGMYGGCPYRDRCNISPLRSIDMPDVPADASVLLKKLAEKAALRAAGANGSVAPATDTAAPVAPVASPVPAVVQAPPEPPVAVQAPPAAPLAPPVAPQAPGAGIFDLMLKDKPIGHTIYNGGFAHTKMPDGTTFTMKPTAEQYAAGEAAQSAKTVSVTAPVPTPLEAAAERVVQPQNGPAAPFTTASVAIVPPDAPPRTSTIEEVNAAVNPPAAEPKRGRGRPIGSTNKSEVSLGKFVQILLGPENTLIGLDEAGMVWIMDVLGDKVWRRLPPPNVG